MTRQRIRGAKYDEDRVRILWDRREIYEDLHAIAVGGRVLPRWVAFFDRDLGITATVPRIVDGFSVRAWTRNVRRDDLAAMAMSADHKDRTIAQTIIATRATGLWLDLKKDVFVYLLSAPDDGATAALPGTIPLGDYVPGAGHANLAVTWHDLTRAKDCAHLRSGSNGGRQ